MRIEQPLVSIILPSYNHEKYVQESIQGIIEQDYESIELIIIDDGSKDNSIAKIKKMIPRCEQRFTRFEFRARENKGLCTTLNEAIKWCKGQFVSIIASDDIILPKKTSIQANHLNNNDDCIAVFGGVVLVDKNSSVIGDRTKKASKLFFDDIFLMKNMVFAPTQMIRLNSLRTVGGYIERFDIEDFYMWLKLTEGGGYLEDLPVILSKYRLHDSNSSSQFEKMHLGRLEIINQYEGHSLYMRALASAHLAFAMDVQSVDKLKAINIFFSSLRLNLSILKDKKSYRFLIKVVTPRLVIKIIRRL